jgi:hypothetical protein
MAMGSLTDRARSRHGEEIPGLAWFITPHGFGHAARASAVMAACSSLNGCIRHHIFTTVPRGFFDQSLVDVDRSYHRLECDVGMVQRTPFEEDEDETIRALCRLPFDDDRAMRRLTERVALFGCHLVVCDIAPLGLAIADRLSVPGVLVENFTWDWIYAAYGHPGLDRYGEMMARLHRSAALRIQTEPVCRAADAGLKVAPVSRTRRQTRAEVRRALGVPADRPMVLVSMNSLGSKEFGRRDLRLPSGTSVVMPGSADRVSDNGKTVSFPAVGGPYHPDLVGASDLVIGKLGYSTVAEVYHSGSAFAYLRRARFPESPILEAFVREHIPSAPMPSDWLDSPETGEVLESLLNTSRPSTPRPNGADEAAKLILALLQLRS